MAKKSTTKSKAKETAKSKTASTAKAKTKKAETQSKPKAAPSKVKTAKPKKPVNKDLTPVIMIKHNDVASKAYEIWLAKGRPIGQDEQNWLEAEASLAKK